MPPVVRSPVRRASSARGWTTCHGAGCPRPPPRDLRARGPEHDLNDSDRDVGPGVGLRVDIDVDVRVGVDVGRHTVVHL